jgi:hypothetical protein
MQTKNADTKNRFIDYGKENINMLPVNSEPHITMSRYSGLARVETMTWGIHRKYLTSLIVSQFSI